MYVVTGEALALIEWQILDWQLFLWMVESIYSIFGMLTELYWNML